MERCKAFKFNTPTSLMIAGPSGCGKTVFTTRLLLENTNLFATLPAVFITVMDRGNTDLKH